MRFTPNCELELESGKKNGFQINSNAIRLVQVSTIIVESITFQLS